MKAAALISGVSIEAQRVAHQASEDAVHDLRVAIRRLNVALRIAVHPESQDDARKLRKRLRKARLAAGDVRDRDIALATLREAGIDDADPLSAQLAQQRHDAALVLQDAAGPLAREGFISKWRSRIAFVNTQPEWDPAAEIDAYFEAGRLLAAGQPQPADLHQFRIAGKHLRYTLELMRPFYGPALNRLVSLLREAQDHLGIINDCATVRALIQSTAESRPGVEEFLTVRSNQSLTQFQQLWTARIDVPTQQQRWVRYLKNPRKSAVPVRRKPKA